MSLPVVARILAADKQKSLDFSVGENAAEMISSTLFGWVKKKRTRNLSNRKKNNAKRTAHFFSKNGKST